MQATLPDAVRPAIDPNSPVGKPLLRRDGREKVTGRATYSAEWHTPDVVHAVGIQSHIARGMIASFDVAEAERVSGFKVLTHETVPTMNAPAPFSGGGAAGTVVGPLSGPEIFHAGQWIACCFGKTLQQARHAARLVKVNYASTQTPQVTLESGAGDAEIARGAYTRGDPETAFEQAAVQVDAEYYTPTEHHNPIEPHATIAQWSKNDLGEPTLTVHDASQYIFGVRDTLAKAFTPLGLKAENTRVICKFMGGAFGCKGNMWPHTLLAAAAAKFLDKPVKFVIGREQMFDSIGFRTDTRQRVRLGADKDGTLTTQIHDGIAGSNKKDNYIENFTLATKVMYASPALLTRQHTARLDTQAPTFMRAPGECPGMFASECAMDELAERLGMDPVDLRKKNEPASDQTTGHEWSGRRAIECYDRVAEGFKLMRGPRVPRQKQEGHWLIGEGFSASTFHANMLPNSVKLRANVDGTFLITCGTHEMGTGTTTAQSQLAAEMLGVPVSRVRFELGDTRMPFGHVSGGSMTTAGVGTAILAAVARLTAKLAETAATNGLVPAGVAALRDAKLQSGRLVSGDRSLAIEDIIASTMNDSIEIEASSTDHPKPEGAKRYSAHSFGAHACEVAVDEQMGLVRVRRWHACFACGRILNAQTARSQFLGGIVMGIGQALTEEGFRDPRSGKITNHNLAEYHVPVNADIPPMTIEWLEDDADYNANPVGAKGIGEIGITGVAAAVANAVWHATGRRQRILPLTPSHVMSSDA